MRRGHRKLKICPLLHGGFFCEICRLLDRACMCFPRSGVGPFDQRATSSDLRGVRFLPNISGDAGFVVSVLSLNAPDASSLNRALGDLTEIFFPQ